MEASLFTKLTIFQLVQTFFVAAVSGSLFTALGNSLTDVSSVARILGETIPGTSTFFMAVIVIQGGLSLTLGLLRVVPVIIAYLHKKIAPQLTERERQNPWMGLKPLWFPGEFEQASLLAEQFFIFVLIVVFGPIAPLVSYFAFAYFCICDVVYRRELFFVTDPSFNTAGVYWPNMFNAIIIAMLVGQACIFGVLGLKQSPASAAILVLIVLTVLYKQYVLSAFPRTAQYLPVNESCRVDRSRSARDADSWAFLDNAYSQPAMQEREALVPEYTQYDGGNTTTQTQSRTQL